MQICPRIDGTGTYERFAEIQNCSTMIPRTTFDHYAISSTTFPPHRILQTLLSTSGLLLSPTSPVSTISVNNQSRSRQISRPPARVGNGNVPDAFVADAAFSNTMKLLLLLLLVLGIVSARTGWDPQQDHDHDPTARASSISGSHHDDDGSWMKVEEGAVLDGVASAEQEWSDHDSKDLEFESDCEEQSDEEDLVPPVVAVYGLGGLVAYLEPPYLTVKRLSPSRSPKYPRRIILSEDTVRAAKEKLCELGYARDVSTLKLLGSGGGEQDSRELADEEPLFGPLPQTSKVQKINMIAKSPVELLHRITTSTDEDELLEIIGELARRTTPGDGSVLEILLALLDTSAEDALGARPRGARVREVAAKVVGQIAEGGRGSVAEGAVRVLVNRLGMDPEKGVRRACVVSLQQVASPGDATVISVLLQRLEDDEDVDVRFVVSKALLALVSPDTLDRIVAGLKQRLVVERNVHARLVIIWGLHGIAAQFDATVEIRKVDWCGLGVFFVSALVSGIEFNFSYDMGNDMDDVPITDLVYVK